MSDSTRQFAVITGGSSGIGLALAKQFLTNGFDILIAADTGVSQAAETLCHEAPELNVEVLESDLSTEEGISTLYDAIQATGRPVDALAANAGIGAGESFSMSHVRPGAR